MKAPLFCARPDTCREAVSALKLSIFPLRGLQTMEEWNEQRTHCLQEVKNVLSLSRAKDIKPIMSKKRINQYSVNDYP